MNRNGFLWLIVFLLLALQLQLVVLVTRMNILRDALPVPMEALLSESRWRFLTGVLEMATGILLLFCLFILSWRLSS